MNLETYLVLPLAAALAMYFMSDRGARTFGVLVSALQVVAGLCLVGGAVEAAHLKTFVAWLPQIGLNWSMAIDGANIWLVLLTPLITGLALLTVADNTPRASLYAANLMLLNGMLTGLFLAQNLGLFYIFFEAMLIPAVLLVAGWSKVNGRDTAFRFVMFTLVGSLPMLLGVLMLAFSNQGPDRSPSLEFLDLAGLAPDQQMRLFLLFLLAFMVKMPIVPFHGWLPPLYRNAPAPVIAVIAAMMSKAGAYGLYKIGFTIFPQAMVKFLPFVGTLAVLSLLYGAFAALGSESLREVLAYSSLSHMAMIALGIVTFTTVGAAGASLQMAGHALATGGLFLAVALMEKRDMPDELRRFGGMARSTPRFAALVLFLTLASLGQPGLGSFPGELLILTGVYDNFPAIAIVSSLGIVLAAAYMLRWYQSIFTGELGTYRPPSDLRGREVAVLLVPITLSLIMGFAPSIFLQPIQTWLTGVV
jgi:NADH-quinone oxidoreductase subunit M